MIFETGPNFLVQDIPSHTSSGKPQIRTPDKKEGMSGREREREREDAAIGGARSLCNSMSPDRARFNRERKRGRVRVSKGGKGTGEGAESRRGSLWPLGYRKGPCEVVAVEQGQEVPVHHIFLKK